METKIQATDRVSVIRSEEGSMPRACSICAHPQRAAIEKALFANGTFRNIAERFRVATSSLHRHKQHVPVEVQKALKGEKITAHLPPRKQKYVEGVVAGKSKRQAALEAGFSESMASHAATKIETPDVRVAFARLVREVIPPERIVETLSAGMNATETRFFSSEAGIEERQVPDYSERRRYAELAVEYGGYYQRDSKEEREGGGIILIFDDSPNPEPENRTVVQPSTDGKAPIRVLPDSQATPVEPQKRVTYGGLDEPEEGNG